MLSSKYRYRVISGFRPILSVTGFQDIMVHQSSDQFLGHLAKSVSKPVEVTAFPNRIYLYRHAASGSFKFHASRSSDNTFFDIMIMDEFHLIVSFTVNTQNSLSHQEFLTIWRNFKILRILTGAGTGTAKMLNYFAVQQDSWIQVSSNLPGSAGSLKWVVPVVWA